MNIQFNITIDDRYIEFIKKVSGSRRGRITILLVLLAGLSFALYAAPGSITIPNTFSSGTVISSAAVNSNFTTVVNKINDNDARITTLESKKSPIAFGFVASDGSHSSGSTNWSAVWNAGSSRYEVTISGESYFYTNYTTIVTPATAGIFPSVGSVGGLLLVTFYNTAGAPVQSASGFQFVTFK